MKGKYDSLQWRSVLTKEISVQMQEGIIWEIVREEKE